MLESYESGSWHSQWMCTNRCFLAFLHGYCTWGLWKCRKLLTLKTFHQAFTHVILAECEPMEVITHSWVVGCYAKETTVNTPFLLLDRHSSHTYGDCSPQTLDCDSLSPWRGFLYESLFTGSLTPSTEERLVRSYRPAVRNNCLIPQQLCQHYVCSFHLSIT